MAGLAIVWRNSKKVDTRVRCSQRTEINGRSIYNGQQLLSAEHDLWINTAVFEVIRGRRGTRTIPEPVRGLRFGCGE